MPKVCPRASQKTLTLTLSLHHAERPLWCDAMCTTRCGPKHLLARQRSGEATAVKGVRSNASLCDETGQRILCHRRRKALPSENSLVDQQIPELMLMQISITLPIYQLVGPYSLCENQFWCSLYRHMQVILLQSSLICSGPRRIYQFFLLSLNFSTLAQAYPWGTPLPSLTFCQVPLTGTGALL